MNMLGPAISNPTARIIGNWNHPDCLGNHWLLVWVAERVLSLESLLHNPNYYAPIGDAPWLAGNGSEGILYAPFHALWGWPLGANLYFLSICTFNGLGAYAFGRSIGGGRFGSLLVVVAIGFSPYLTQELSSGRFSQANVGFFLCSLALFFHLLEKPSKKAAVALAFFGAATCLFYFYYGFFLGLIALARLAHKTVKKEPLPREFWLACAMGLALVLPLLWLYASHWEQIPGTSENLFPHPESRLHASSWAPRNWIVGKGRMVAMSQSLSLLILASLACFYGRKGAPSRLFLLAMAFLAWVLCLGPHGGLYTALYGLHPALQRFWWPMRHTLILTTMVAALATRAIPVRWENKKWPVLLLVLSVPLSFRAQGLVLHAKTSSISLPPLLYQSLGQKDGEMLLQTPLNPRLNSTQTPLITQFFHKKKMLNGHAPWVDRVRPKAWDSLVENNSFLAGLKDFEGGKRKGKVEFKAEDLNELVDFGLRYLVVDQEFYLLKLRPLVASTRSAFRDLFGPPVLRGKRAWVFDTANWNQKTTFDFPQWTWPKGLHPGKDGQTINGRRPPSVLFPPQSTQGP